MKINNNPTKHKMEESEIYTSDKGRGVFISALYRHGVYMNFDKEAIPELVIQDVIQEVESWLEERNK